METVFDIKPYLGTGDICIGMSKSEVDKVLGKADESSKSMFSNETKEFRFENGLQVVYSETEKTVVEISCYRNIPNVTFNQVNVFDEPGMKIMKVLADADGSPLETVGIIVFQKLGVSITGFDDDDNPGGKSLTVFARGRMDEYLDDAKPFTTLSTKPIP